jgi:transcriptional regulator GlxA family with amidase domain
MIPVLLYEGVSGAEALAALAALQGGGLAAELVSTEAVVTTREGARLVPARLGLGTLATAEAAVFPGGDVARVSVDVEVARTLRARRGHWNLFSGEAVHLAARVGLAEGRRVARPPDNAAVQGAEATAPSRLVADGRLLTCTGGDALVDLALHYVAHVNGADAARRSAEAMGRAWQPYAMGAGESRA